MRILSIRSLMVVALIVASLSQPAMVEAKKKYAKTELDKAIGKCVGSVLLGGLVGALVGRAVGGKRGTGTGAVVGVAAGGAICAILVAQAKQKDKIIAAQMLAAANPKGRYATYYTDDNAQPVHLTAVAQPAEQIDSARLTPVKYESSAGDKVISPELTDGPQLCRKVDTTLSGSSGVAKAPQQIYCRTPDGDYQPYAVGTI